MKTIEEFLKILQQSNFKFLDTNGSIHTFKDCFIGDIIINDEGGEIKAYDESGYNADWELPENCSTSSIFSIKERIKQHEDTIEYIETTFKNRKESGMYSDLWIGKLEDQLSHERSELLQEIEKLKNLPTTQVIMFESSKTDHDIRVE